MSSVTHPQGQSSNGNNIWSLCACVAGSRSNSIVSGANIPTLSQNKLAEELQRGLNVKTIWLRRATSSSHVTYEWQGYDLLTFKLLLLSTPCLPDDCYDVIRHTLHVHFTRMTKDTEALKIFLLAGNDVPRVVYNELMEFVHACDRSTRIQKWVAQYNMRLIKPLLHLARKEVRRNIRHNTVSGVQGLPLPPAMKEFINLSDAIHEVPYNNVPVHDLSL